MSSNAQQPRKDFIAGLDAGGTKVHIVDTISTNLHRYNTADFPDLESLLAAYFETAGAVPQKMVMAIAGPRDDSDGSVKISNHSWPTFYPSEAAKKYPGTTFLTTNDMVATAAGIVQAQPVDLKGLKSGVASPKGTKLIVALSTGINICPAIWDEYSSRHVFMPCEAGQMGFQPYTPAQRRHLDHLFKQYEHPSVELAMSGKFGIPAWIEHCPELETAPTLQAALERANAHNRPLGAVLLEYATEGSGADQGAARAILDHMGTFVGNILADFALICKATGGVYLTGSVALGLSEYWAEHTGLAEAFVRTGSAGHAPWLEEFMNAIPIYLSTDPHVAVKGALALAEQ